jgi:signal peptidase I
MFPSFDVGDRLFAEKITYKFLRCSAPHQWIWGAHLLSVVQLANWLYSVIVEWCGHVEDDGWNFCRQPQAGDVVIFHPDFALGNGQSWFNDDVFIKRIVATAGDTVEVIHSPTCTFVVG